MNESIDVDWVCKLWLHAATKIDWDHLNWQFQGAGMAIFPTNQQAARDYWALSDLAFQRYIELK